MRFHPPPNTFTSNTVASILRRKISILFRSLFSTVEIALSKDEALRLASGLDGLEHCFGGSLATSSNGEFSCDSQTLWAAQATRPMTFRDSLIRSAHKRGTHSGVFRGTVASIAHQ